MSSFGTYIIGFFILIVGLAVAAYLIGLSPTWIAVGVVILLGVAVISATTRTRPRDPPAT